MAKGIALPMRIDRLAERSLRDQSDEEQAARAESPADRLLLALELSDLTRGLAESASAAWTRSPSRLEEKIIIYVAPLRAAVRVVR